jgi:hypothetical protein
MSATPLELPALVHNARVKFRSSPILLNYFRIAGFSMTEDMKPVSRDQHHINMRKNESESIFCNQLILSRWLIGAFLVVVDGKLTTKWSF